MTASKSKALTNVATPTGARRRVLLVDDEQLLLDTIALLLEPDFDVVATNDSEHAWELLRDGARFDVIVSDLSMPSPDGRELYERLLQLDPLQAEHFLIVTGGAANSRGRVFLESMEGRVLLKPFGATELIRNVDRVARQGEPVNDPEEVEGAIIPHLRARSGR